MTSPLFTNPFKRTAFIGLVLGVCLFSPLFSSRVWAIDSNSPLFEKSQNSVTDKEKGGALPLPEETPNPSPGVFSIFLRVCLSLIFIGALIFVTVWGVKIIWEKQGWNALGEQGKSIKVLTSTYLGPRKAIYLVEIGKRVLVVGVGKDEMTCLDVITEPEEVEAIRQTNQQGFPKILNRIVAKHDASQQEEDAKKIIEESNQLVGGYVAKLKKIAKNKKSSPEKKEEA